MPMLGDKVMNHTEYPKQMKKRTEEELRYTIKDAGLAIEANPDNLNNGYYRDEQLYCAAELRRRGLK
jgi:hypothetical protein